MSTIRTRWLAELKAARAAEKVARAVLKRASERVAYAERVLARHPPKSAAPAILTAADLGFTFVNRFGALGPERYVTGHHTAGPTDKDRDDAIRLCQQYHAAHAAKGWGGIGYHFNIARDGTIICLRPLTLKGAHVGLHNSENVGVMFHGTTGDLPTQAQRNSYRWILANAHTTAMPRPHRSDRDLRKAKRRGHNDWPGHESNACPGTHKPMILAGG
jgi:hypothetical protein